MYDPGSKALLRTAIPAMALAFLLLLPIRPACGYGGSGGGGGGGGGGDVGGPSSEASTPPTGYTPASSGGSLTESTLSGVTISSDWAEVQAEGQAAEQAAQTEQAAYENFVNMIDQEGMDIQAEDAEAGIRDAERQEAQAQAEAEAQAQRDRQQHILEHLADRSPEAIAGFLHEFPTMELQEQYIDIRTQIHHLDNLQDRMHPDDYQATRQELTGQIQDIREQVAQERGEEVIGQFTTDVAVNTTAAGLATLGTPGIVGGIALSGAYNYSTGGTRAVGTGLATSGITAAAGAVAPGVPIGPVAEVLIQNSVDAGYQEIQDSVREDGNGK